LSKVQELQFWKERCESLKRDLEAAKLHRAEVETRYRGGSILSEDFYGYRRAVEAENDALTEYSRALRIYANLAIHGKASDDHADTARGA
jgi:hypothetical protein